MKRRTKWILGLAVLGAAGVTAVAARGSEEAPAAAVEVTRGEIVDRALAVGRIEPQVEVSVKSQLAGVVRREFADLGDYVRRGAPLLEVQPNPTPQELVEARRNLELRQVELEDLERRKGRLEALRGNEFVTQEELESVVRQWELARLQFQMARERLALLEEGRVTIGSERVETVVTSPIDGFILEKSVELGDPVVPLTTFQEGTVLMRMAAMDALIFRGTVDEIDVGRLREGMRAEIKIGALPEAGLEGVVRKISLKGRQEDQATRFPVEIAVTGAEGTVLRAGYSANAEIVIERREDVVTIPERVVSFSGDTARVRVALPDGTAEERVIRTGLGDGILVEVVEGLEPGERVLEPPTREIQ